jgi:hypothetical protein
VFRADSARALAGHLLKFRALFAQERDPGIGPPVACFFLRNPMFTVYGLASKNHMSFAWLAGRHRKLEPFLY